MSTNGKNDPIDGIAGAVEGLAVSPTLTSDELAYRLARKVAELADDDPRFLGEAQDAAGVIAGVLGDSIAAGPWAEIVDRIERHFDRTAPGIARAREVIMAALAPLFPNARTTVDRTGAVPVSRTSDVTPADVAAAVDQISGVTDADDEMLTRWIAWMVQGGEMMLSISDTDLAGVLADTLLDGFAR